jgi:phosphoribosylaminoimidazolecarboxamide formyltransferase / IMP cyclohydrolase
VKLTIKRALISVSDKTGLVDFARSLMRFGVEILSTGGTAKLLREAGIAAKEVSEHTGFPEMLDGRVKTLHPKIHGGILGRRDLPAHMTAMAQHGIVPIDLVLVNLYPFRETIAKAGVSLEDAIENIDIGGPAMVRAAAKNYHGVAVVTDPQDYARLLNEMTANSGAVSLETRFGLAKKAFSHTAEYDGAISNYLTAVAPSGDRAAFPERWNIQFDKVQDLRYGENPHQRAAFYRERVTVPGAISNYRQLQGKELSYNNIADAEAAWECVKAFTQTACVIVKHANPCGVGVAADPLSAYQLAYATDPTSAFGGIIAFNREVDATTAQAVTRQFLELLIAPRYADAALEVLKTKANVRALQVPLEKGTNGFDLKRVGGGVLIQSPDAALITETDLKIVTKVRPSMQQLADLIFAFRVAKYVKSNAIVFCANGQTLGIGAGQMSRVDSTRLAAMKAKNAGLTLLGSVAASDAFFPFRDGLDVIAEAGAKAVIQPGGSMRDDEVIAAADEHGIAMVLTGVRHFRH